jgi:hypothetical protein
MKRSMMGLVALTAILLTAGVSSVKTLQSRTSSLPSNNHQDNPPSPLTKSEERDLQRLISQALAWIATWHPAGVGCTDDQMEMATLIKQHAGEQVELGLRVTETNIGVNIDQLHVYFGFRRLHNLGLGPPKVDYFCESSYEEYIANIKRRSEQTREAHEEAMKRAKSDPLIGDVLRQIREKQAQIPIGKAERQEVRSYTIPLIEEKQVEPEGYWSEEKKYLYKRIIAVVRKEAEEIYCVPGKIVEITVPDFEIGDTGIFLLAEAQEPHGKSVEWIKFDREILSGKYDAYHAKSYELWPSETEASDALLRLRDLIRRKKVKTEKITCP